MDILTIFTSALIFIIVSVVVWIKQQQKFWKNLGVECQEPSFLLGNLNLKLPVAELMCNFYNDIKSKNLKYGGFYFLFRPLFLPVDPDLIKKIMVKDFDHFVDRGIYFDEENDPLTAHLFSLEGKKWKNLRAKVTPTFTSGKMKIMFSTIVDCSKNLVVEMDKLCYAKEAVDMKDMLARFNTDMIASVAFGLDTNSVANPNAEFHRKGEQFFSPGPIRQILQLFMFAIPSVTKFLKLKVLPPELSEFYFRIIRDTVNYREQNNVIRKDFMHMLIQLKNKGAVADGDSVNNATSDKNDERISFNELAAQAFVFFLAGFETSSTTETFCLYELAVNPDIQQTVRDEIEETLAKCDGELTYDALMEMSYLDKVVNETLRKYSPLPTLNRVCTKDYKIPDSDLMLKAGMRVFIPLMGLHHDEEYYPNPKVFDPERFSEENKRKRHPYTFLPFGEGPRICIGMRFGLMQTKIGIISLVKNYKITVNPKTKQPIEFDPKSFILTTKGGMWLEFKNL